MRAPIRDTEIFFDVDGAGLVADGAGIRERPTAFLVHGGPGSDHTGLKARLSPLTRSMQLVYFDQRGHGRSSRGDPARYTLDETVKDLEALRRYLGVQQIVSIGASYGGMVAMAHAARFPDSVSHLILIATAAHSGYLVNAREIVAKRGTHEQSAQFEDLLAGRIDTADKLHRYHNIMGPLYARSFDPMRAKQAGQWTIRSADVFNRAYRPGGFLRSFDLRPELHAITAPTLILAGRHDWICAPEFSVEIHRLIPGSDLRIFEDSGHAIAADEPQKFFDVVTGFLVYRLATEPLSTTS